MTKSEQINELATRTRFEALYEPEPTSGCFLWLAAFDKDGYGLFKGPGDVMVRAHRAAYRLYVGPIRSGLTLDHHCRVRSCVNPRHLEPVTNRENILRGYGPAAINARKRACMHGHPFSPDNTHVWNGQRECRMCRRLRQRGYVQRRREGVPS